MKTRKCDKCNNDMLFLMEFREGVDTYYCPNCFVTVDIVKATDKDFAWCHPTIAIEDALCRIASSIPNDIFESKNISKDTFLRILLDKKKKESLKNLMK